MEELIPVALFLLQEAIKDAPEIEADIQQAFSLGVPTPDDWAALRAKLVPFNVAAPTSAAQIAALEASSSPGGTPPGAPAKSGTAPAAPVPADVLDPTHITARPATKPNPAAVLGAQHITAPAPRPGPVAPAPGGTAPAAPAPPVAPDPNDGRFADPHELEDSFRSGTNSPR